MAETPTFGRYAEIPYDQMTPEQQGGYRTLIETRGRLPVIASVGAKCTAHLATNLPVAPPQASLHHFSTALRAGERANRISIPRYPVLFPATDHTQSAPSGGYT